MSQIQSAGVLLKVTLTCGAVRRGALPLREVALAWLREADLSEPEIHDLIQQCVAITADQEGAFT
jgi:hypothetical protein